ncbi:MAG: PQQ-like beta-propeller repeat protein, partial [Akkermansiaceae bacterium]|nr:PQQ-like beta-propeller repeat protein [Akkermansiaceae bacterium]
GHDGVVRCRKIADGAEVWSHDAGDQINGSPGLVEGRFVVFGGCASVVHILDLADGEVKNEVVTDAEVLSWVATVGTTVYFANYANQLVAADAFGDKLTWVYEDRDFPFFSNPAVDEERVYIGSRDKHLHAVDRESGQGAWKFKTGSRVDGSALVFDDAVVFGSGDGRLYALNPKDGAEIWRLDLGEGIAASPAFADGQLVIGGDDGTLFSIRGRKPEKQ